MTFGKKLERGSIWISLENAIYVQIKEGWGDFGMYDMWGTRGSKIK